MRVYTANTRRGRVISGDIHHKTRDTGVAWARAQTKSQRHAARQEVHKIVSQALIADAI